MKSDYCDVTDEQIIEKTGRPIAQWDAMLQAFDAAARPLNDSVALSAEGV